MNTRSIGALVLAASLLAASPAKAIIVFDPSNFVENALTAARSLEEINNQLLQLQNEATMLINEARNLTKLPFNIVGQLQATLALTIATDCAGAGHRLPARPGPSAVLPLLPDRLRGQHLRRQHGSRRAAALDEFAASAANHHQHAGAERAEPCRR